MQYTPTPSVKCKSLESTLIFYILQGLRLSCKYKKQSWSMFLEAFWSFFKVFLSFFGRFSHLFLVQCLYLTIFRGILFLCLLSCLTLTFEAFRLTRGMKQCLLCLQIKENLATSQFKVVSWGTFLLEVCSHLFFESMKNVKDKKATQSDSQEVLL